MRMPNKKLVNYSLLKREPAIYSNKLHIALCRTVGLLFYVWFCIHQGRGVITRRGATEDTWWFRVTVPACSQWWPTPFWSYLKSVPERVLGSKVPAISHRMLHWKRTALEMTKSISLSPSLSLPPSLPLPAPPLSLLVRTIMCCRELHLFLVYTTFQYETSFPFSFSHPPPKKNVSLLIIRDGDRNHRLD